MEDWSAFVPDVYFEKIPIRNLVANQDYYCCEHRIDILKIYDRFVASNKGSHKLKK